MWMHYLVRAAVALFLILVSVNAIAIGANRRARPDKPKKSTA